jgi:hypothetical protein
MPQGIDEDGDEPFRLMVDYSPILDNIHDRIAGTTTVYKEEVLRNPLTNQPITNSQGKPITYLKQTAIPKDGVEPLCNKSGVDFVMGALNSVVNRGIAFADVGLSDIVYTANDTVQLLNDNITLNSQKYGITNLAAWKSMSKLIRNFLFNFLSSVKYGGLREWSGNILGVGYQMGGDGSGRPIRKQEGILQRMFSRKQMVDNDAQFGGER